MTFDKIDKQTWLKKLLLDYKADNASALDGQIGLNRSFPAIFHEEDEIPSGILQFANNQAVLIGSDFFIDQDTDQNQDILKALQHGVNAPRFVFQNRFFDFNKIFEGIHLEMIEASYEFNDIETAQEFITYVSHRYSKLNQLNGSVWSSSISLNQTVELFQRFNLFTNCFQCDYSNNELESFPQELLKLCEKIVNFLSDQKEASRKSESFVIRVGIGNSFLMEVAKLRAIRILLANIFRAFNLSPDIHVQLQVFFQTYNQELIASDRMIAASSQAICAFIGNADHITVQSASLEDFHKHVARNVLHVLQQESHLDFVNDPTAGSYYIEELTNRLCEDTWKLLQKD